MNNDKNRTFRIVALVGLLIAFSFGFDMAVPTGVHAATSSFAPDDNFKKGALDKNQDVKVRLTKYKLGETGFSPTGSVNDVKGVPSDATPLQGVRFSLYLITLSADCQASDLKIEKDKAGTTNSSTVLCGTVAETPEYSGITDGNGVIEWDTGKHNKIQYYVLQETNSPSGVIVSQSVIVGLPFYTTDNDGNSGYLYNVSLFPKNISDNQINKSVTGPSVVKSGNKLKYSLTQDIYNGAKGINPVEVSSAQPGDGYLDVSEIESTYTTQLRISDRLPSNLKLVTEPGPKVTWTCDATSHALVQDTDYEIKTTEEDPKRISENGDALLFTDGNTGQGVRYLTFDFWKTPDAATGFKNQANLCSTKIRINIEFMAEVTDNGDAAAGAAGTIQNTANVDVFDGSAGSTNPKGPTNAKSSSAGFTFAKTDINSNKPLAGAVFRLSKPDDPTQFLRETGDFGSEGALVTATSNSMGIVTFSGIPLYANSMYEELEGISRLPDTVKPNATWISQTQGKLHIVEVKSPQGYQAPNTDFGNVDFGVYTDKTASQIAAVGAIVPSMSDNLFGTYTADSAIVENNFKDANGKAIKIGMKNFKPSEAPIGLPLTGGLGIAIFLLIGITVVTITLYMRYRISKVQGSAR